MSADRPYCHVTEEQFPSGEPRVFHGRQTPPTPIPGDRVALRTEPETPWRFRRCGQIGWHDAPDWIPGKHEPIVDASIARHWVEFGVFNHLRRVNPAE